jgi:hypothetical protein
MLVPRYPHRLATQDHTLQTIEDGRPRLSIEPLLHSTWRQQANLPYRYTTCSGIIAAGSGSADQVMISRAAGRRFDDQTRRFACPGFNLA